MDISSVSASIRRAIESQIVAPTVARVTSAIGRSIDGKFGHCAFIRLEREERPARRSLEYPSIDLSEHCLSLDDFYAELEGQASNSNFFGIPRTALAAVTATREYHRVTDPRNHTPCFRWEFSLTQQGVFADNDPVLGPGVPPHDCIAAALQWWLAPNLTDWPPRLGQCVIHMRDDRATIAAAEWNERKLRVRLIAGLPLDRLEVHIVARNASPGIWLPLEAPVIEVELGDLPGDAQVFVLDRSGEVLAAANAGRASMSAPMDAPETPNVLADIRDGERDDVEFKPWIERCGTKERDLLKTIIAFANTRGGRLYVGVDDEGTALSTSFLHRAFKQSDVEAGLRAAAARLHEICTNIHPTPVRTVTLVTIATGRCLRVLVDPGPDPPYMTVDSHEIWVRRGASSLRPLRAELEKWFRPDQIPALYLPNV